MSKSFIFVVVLQIGGLVGNIYVNLREDLELKYLKIMINQKCFALIICFNPLGVHDMYVMTCML